jgi:two-component system, OmpR family, sensor kinase
MSIRWRLTLWFALILLVILVFSDLVLNLILQSYLYNDVDNNLEVYSARVHGTLHSNSNAILDYNVIHSSLPSINEFSSPGIYIQIVDSAGKVAVKSDNLISQELPVSPALNQKAVSGSPGIQTVITGDGTSVRIMASPLYTLDQTLVLEVGQSLKPVDDALRQFRFSLIGGTLLALLLTAALGAILVRRTLEPVEGITRTARSIEESSNLNRRVGYRGPNDEIGRLAKTFDNMIERLEKTFESQKHFIADASHELRTPLTVIQGNLDLLKRNMGEDDRKESLRAIESESKRMSKIAADLLLLAEVEAGQVSKQETVSLKTIVTAELKRAQSTSGQRKLIFGPAEDLNIKGDSYKLSQVIGNLLDNSIKYTPDGGAITISLLREGDWARLEVADTGIGISADDLPHIFERFYRADKAHSRASGGTGLGLAIVKGIVEQHSGRIGVTSVSGRGSTFTVWLKIL